MVNISIYHASCQSLEEFKQSFMQPNLLLFQHGKSIISIKLDETINIKFETRYICVMLGIKVHILE